MKLDGVIIEHSRKSVIRRATVYIIYLCAHPQNNFWGWDYIMGGTIFGAQTWGQLIIVPGTIDGKIRYHRHAYPV